MSNIAIIIQARNGSSRLPRKMVKPFYNDKSILQILVERLQSALALPIWIATTTSPLDDELVETVNDYDVNIFRGEENNVLSRFTGILKKESFQYFIRVCGDNPFLNLNYLKQLVNNSSGYDYTSYYDGDVPVIKTHYGLFTEVIRSKKLLEIENETITKDVKEHVTPFLYENKNKYRIKKLNLPKELNGFNYLRLTVDTEEDFKLTQALYAKHATSNQLDYDFSNLLIDVKMNGYVRKKMLQQIKQNSK